jgi:hypothetical protein
LTSYIFFPQESLDKTKYAGKPSAYVMDVAEMKAKAVLKSVFKGGRDISDLLVVGTAWNVPAETTSPEPERFFGRKRSPVRT